MRVSLLFVGDEVVDGLVENTNASFMKSFLASVGVMVEDVVEVRDDVSMISELIRFLSSYSDGVFVCGGLGPTEDDRTREAVADFLGRKLVFVEEIWQDIRSKLETRGREPREEHKKMALIPEGARYVLSSRGLAPAFWVEDKVLLAAFPGVPWELKELFPKVVGELSVMGGDFFKVYKTFGLKESEVNALVKEALGTLGVRWGTVIRDAEVWVNVKGDAKLEKLVDSVLRKALGDNLFGVDGEELSQVVGRLLKEKGLTLAVAESCTGGLLAHLVTNVSGSSEYFRGGVVAYLEEIKEKLLSVNKKDIEAYTVYSHEVARQMAEGVRRLLEAKVGLSTTGIAGPTGALPGKPVGLVYVGMSIEGHVESLEFRFSYDRLGNKMAFAKAALDVLRRRLS